MTGRERCPLFMSATSPSRSVFLLSVAARMARSMDSASRAPRLKTLRPVAIQVYRDALRVRIETKRGVESEGVGGLGSGTPRRRSQTRARRAAHLRAALLRQSTGRWRLAAVFRTPLAAREGLTSYFGSAYSKLPPTPRSIPIVHQRRRKAVHRTRKLREYGNINEVTVPIPVLFT